jgi:NTE family protein
MRMLGNINQFFADTSQAPGAVDYRRTRGKPPYRKVPYVFVAPERAGAIGELATEAFRRRYGGFRALRSPDLALLNRLLGRESDTHGELLSYLLFDREFMRKLIDMGQRDARAYLSRAADIDDIWQLGPPEELTHPPQPSPAIRGVPAS